MKNALYKLIEIITVIHEKLLSLNDAYETSFTDKELHFIVIGVIGLLMIFAIYPLFKWLAKNNHVMVSAFIYVFTMILVLTFAIEIGQGYTGTGYMEFGDIMFGVVGFLVMFFVFAVIRGIYHFIVRLLKKWDEKIKKNAG